MNLYAREIRISDPGRRTLAGGFEDLEARFSSIPEARGGLVRRIEFRPGILLFPVRTPTKPPATHTNCYVVGDREVEQGAVGVRVRGEDVGARPLT